MSMTLEIREIAAGARAAAWVFDHTDRLEVACPDIAGDQAAVESFFAAREELKGFRYFERGDEVDDGAEHANGVASFLESMAVCRGFEEAGKTRG